MSEKGKPLDKTEAMVMKILDNHKGKESAIAACRLAELVGICDRRLRGVINHLIIDHLIPVGSSSRKKESGYYLITNRDEAREFFEVFKRRAMTSLTKASRIMKAPALVAATQLTIGSVMEGEKVPGAGKAMMSLIQRFKKDPELYKKEIKALQSEFGPLLVDREQMAQIKETAGRLQKLAGAFV